MIEGNLFYLLFTVVIVLLILDIIVAICLIKILFTVNSLIKRLQETMDNLAKFQNNLKQITASKVFSGLLETWMKRRRKR